MSEEDQISERIAGELHDGVVQWLVGAKMQAEGLRFQLAKGQPIDPESVDSLIRSLTSGIHEARRLMRGLSGPQIEDGYWCVPLRAELESLQQQMQSKSAESVAIHFDFGEGAEPQAENIAASAFRLIREAVWNSLRHANAKSIQVSAQQESKWLMLVIEDDGRGFDQSQVPSDRMGVRGLVRRAESVGGSIEIETAPSAGTKISCRLPTG